MDNAEHCERIARRMERIREELDEGGDLQPDERRRLVWEYRMLCAQLMRAADRASDSREE